MHQHSSGKIYAAFHDLSTVNFVELWTYVFCRHSKKKRVLDILTLSNRLLLTVIVEERIDEQSGIFKFYLYQFFYGY